MLPQSVMSFLTKAAKDARTSLPEANSSLFLAGVLDSFSLVDFVSVIETECGIRVSDSDLRPGNFDTINKVESYIQRSMVHQ